MQYLVILSRLYKWCGRWDVLT